MAGTRGAYIKAQKAKRAKENAAHDALQQERQMCMPKGAYQAPTAPKIEKAAPAKAIDENKPTYHRRGRGAGKWGAGR